MLTYMYALIVIKNAKATLIGQRNLRLLFQQIYSVASHQQGLFWVRKFLKFYCGIFKTSTDILPLGE